MEFKQFVAFYKPGQCHTIVIAPPHWLYFYRRCDASYPAVTHADGALWNLSPSSLMRLELLIRYTIECIECGPMKASGEKALIDLRTNSSLNKEHKLEFDALVKKVRQERALLK
jgi:hypothetical protein